MNKHRGALLAVLAAVLLTTGCAAAWIAGGIAAVGAGAGGYILTTRDVKVDYGFPLEKVWNACKQTMADVKATNVESFAEIDRKTIYAVINGEDVQVSVTYKSKNVTTVAIRVGTTGSKSASQFLHDKINENLSRG